MYSPRRKLWWRSTSRRLVEEFGGVKWQHGRMSVVGGYEETQLTYWLSLAWRAAGLERGVGRAA